MSGTPLYVELPTPPFPKFAHVLNYVVYLRCLDGVPR